MVYSRSLPLALVPVVFLVPIRGKSRTHGWKEQKRSHRPTKLISCFTRPCLRLCIPALARALHLYIRGRHLFLRGRCPHQQAQVRHSFLRILGRHSLSQVWALKLRLIQQDPTSFHTAMRLYLYRSSQRDLHLGTWFESMARYSSSVCRLSCVELQDVFIPLFVLHIPPPLNRVLSPSQILPLPLPVTLCCSSPFKEDPDATGKPNTICTTQKLDGGVTLYLSALACAPLC